MVHNQVIQFSGNMIKVFVLMCREIREKQKKNLFEQLFRAILF